MLTRAALLCFSACCSRRQAAKPPAFFKTPLSAAEMAEQAGGRRHHAPARSSSICSPDLAPNHVGYFMKLAREGAYNGTIFHRVIKYGIVQGGDPLSKDPAKAKLYGTGGLGVLKAEIERREGDARRGGGGAAARASPTAPAPSSSSA